MTTLSIIVAIDANNAIGKDNQMLCHLPNDLKYFKTVTSGHTVIMGRNTYYSLPNGALPNRRNIVLSSKKNFTLEKCEIYHNLDEALSKCAEENEVFIMGGGILYKEAINCANKLYITHIHHEFDEADVFFPTIDLKVWKEISRVKNEKDDRNPFAHDFVVYERK